RAQDSFCRQGFGTILEKAAQGLPVRLSTPVTEINYFQRSAAVLKTKKGTLRARAVIVTVSVGVLAAGIIKFEPHLPLRHLEAVTKLSLGNYDHIVMDIPGNPLGLDMDGTVYEKATSNQTAALLANVSGTSLCVIDVGGSFAHALSAQGKPA